MAPPSPPPPQMPPPGPQAQPQPSPVDQSVKTAEMVVSDVKREVPRNLTEFERLPPAMMALVGGGFLALGLGFLFLIINLIGLASTVYFVWGVGYYLCAVLQFLADLVLGVGLLYCYVLAKRGNWFRAMWLGAVMGIGLCIFGNPGGVIGGLVGLIGAALIFLDDNLRHRGEPGYVVPLQPVVPPPPTGPVPPPPY